MNLNSCLIGQAFLSGGHVMLVSTKRGNRFKEVKKH